MRFYYQHQDSTSDQKVSTKCVRIQSKDTTSQVVENLVEKFRLLKTTFQEVFLKITFIDPI